MMSVSLSVWKIQVSCPKTLFQLLPIVYWVGERIILNLCLLCGTVSHTFQSVLSAATLDM